METLEKLRHRIDTTNELESVVRTMKGLAAVSIRAFETASQAVEQYARTVELGLQIVVSRNPELALPRILASGKETIGVIVFGSEQGLCGSFNRLVSDFASGELTRLPRFRLAAAGARAAESLTKDHHHEQVARLQMPVSVDGITDRVTDALVLATDWIETEHVTQIRLIHHRMVSGATYAPASFTLFPFDRAWIEQLRADSWTTKCVPTHFSPGQGLLKKLIRHHLFIGLYRAFAESLAAEHAARLAAMQAAEKNIEQRLTSLRQSFHQLRQATITEELLDVVSGFEALK
jgi:F-type H+-transporting ATPase subunit gamma